MIINDPAILAEITVVFARYETALIENDVATLDALFWNSPLALRYGVGERLYGHAAIAAFRQARSGGSPCRYILKQAITTYGADFATADIEFQREGETRIGRQSQSWVRMPEGWRIVAAHISLEADKS